jgi:hypothetical protein
MDDRRQPSNHCSHKVWRQDDHGNKFLVADVETKQEAEEMVGYFTAKGHKQMYWYEPVNESEAQATAEL